MTYRRAERDEDKDEILRRLFLVWQANPELRLMQLLGNVYRDRASAYNVEDYDMIEAVEQTYWPCPENDSAPGGP